MKYVIGPLLLLALAISGVAQQPTVRGQLDMSPAVFTVMTAVNAAGFDAGIDSPWGNPLRRALREEVARRNPAVLPELRTFLRLHRQDDAAADMRLYLSYAVLIKDPPSFEFRDKEPDLPPDVVNMKGLGPLLKRFYQETNIPELMARAVPEYDRAIAQYFEPASQALNDASGYLRVPTGPTYMGRRFQVYLCLECTPNQTLFYPVGSEYFLVLAPAPQPQFEEIRRAYLHFLLDQLATNNMTKLDEKRGLIDYAQGAPFLADHYKQDFLLLATASLVRAVEARMSPASTQVPMVNEAMGEGFVLTAHFYEQLPLYEKGDQQGAVSMRFYFPALITSIDLRKEARRLEALQFTQTRSVKVIKAPPVAGPPALVGIDKVLDEAETLYRAKDYAAARTKFQDVVAEAEQKPDRAKGYYGLARIAAQQRDPDLAQKLFEQVLEMNPPVYERSWSLISLGRLALNAVDEQDVAVKRFNEALAIDGAAEDVRKAAQQGLEQAKRQQQ